MKIEEINNPAVRQSLIRSMARQDAEFAANRKPNTLAQLREIREQIVEKPKTRLRQPKSLFDSKLEIEWFDHARLDPRYSHGIITPKGIRLRLASGLHYTADFVLRRPESDRMFCFEVKGPRAAKGVSKGVAALKMAAAAWPEFTFVFVWKQDGQWCEQIVKP